MRAFLGIDFNIEVKAAISQFQRDARAYAVRGSWKHHDNFHITLKFFENIKNLDKASIDRVVREECKNRESFELKFSELGVFKGKEEIRVLWLGLGGELDSLLALQQGIDERLYEVGFEKDKREFMPHVTLGQNLTFSCGTKELTELNSNIFYPKLYVERVNLFMSEQVGPRRIYTRISEYELKKYNKFPLI